jgi:preprotein translocase subunit SecF
MKKIIKFTKIRFLAISISLTLIVIGIASYVINNGFNMGIDFAGGLVMQVQIAPQAITISNNSQNDIQVEVAKGGLLETEKRIIQVTDAENKIHEIELNKIATLQKLAEELNSLVGITAKVTGNADLAPEVLISVKKTVPGQESLVLNRQLQPGEPIFAPIEDVRALLAPIPNMNLQVVGTPEQQQYMMRASVSGSSAKTTGNENTEVDVYEAQAKKIEELFRAKYGADQVIIIQSETMGVQLAQVLAMNSIGFVFIAIVFMFIYITFRFRLTFAVGAILALVHDVLMMLGFISITGIEFNTIMIAAVLTIVGYSINDTIVV